MNNFIEKYNQEVELLQKEPKLFLANYQKLIDHGIHFFIQHSSISFSYDELNNLVQKRLPTLLLHNKKQFDTTGSKLNIHYPTFVVENLRLLLKDIEELHWLQNASSALILPYLPYLKRRAQYFLSSSSLPGIQTEDIAQMVQEKLLQKIESGQLLQYQQQRSSLFSSYFKKVIENVLKDVLRTFHSRKAQAFSSIRNLDQQSQETQNLFEQIAQKMDWDYTLHLFDFNRAIYKDTARQKLELCSKVNAFIILKDKDVIDLFLSEERKVDLLGIFGKYYGDLSKEVVWSELVRFTNEIEGKPPINGKSNKNKTNKGDALWKWFNRQRNRILAKIMFISALNGPVSQKFSETEKQIIVKLNERTTGKLANNYFVEIVLQWQKKENG